VARGRRSGAAASLGRQHRRCSSSLLISSSGARGRCYIRAGASGSDDLAGGGDNAIRAVTTCEPLPVAGRQPLAIGWVFRCRQRSGGPRNAYKRPHRSDRTKSCGTRHDTHGGPECPQALYSPADDVTLGNPFGPYVPVGRTWSRHLLAPPLTTATARVPQRRSSAPSKESNPRPLECRAAPGCPSVRDGASASVRATVFGPAS